MYSHFAFVSYWQTSNNIATYLANQVNNQRFFNNHQMTLRHSDCEDTSDTVCQQQSWSGLHSPGLSYVSSTCRCYSVISLGIKQACKNKTRRKFLQVSGRHLLPLSCFETKERQLFYCFVWIILGIFRSERFSHFSFIFSCMYNLSVSRWSDKSSVVFMCNTNFDSELIFYACVPTKKIVFLFMFSVEVELRTK